MPRPSVRCLRLSSLTVQPVMFATLEARSDQVSGQRFWGWLRSPLKARTAGQRPSCVFQPIVDGISG